MQLWSFASHRSYAEGSRRYPRLILSAPITLQHLLRGGVRNSHGVSLDLSEGGLGALVEVTLGVGDTVGIELKLPGDDLNAVGIVRYSSNGRSGFEFLGLKPEERLRIASLVESA